MDDEFTLVKSKRGKRRNQTKSISIINNFEDNTFDHEKLRRKLTEITEKLQDSHFVFEFLKDLRSVLHKLRKTEVDVILCYGLGKFSESVPALHQLALLLFLQQTFESVVEIYDPVFSSHEISFLKHYNFVVIEVNEEGKRTVEDNKVTLAYLVHCPKQLVNNFLWANWSEKLINCIVISNSFTNIRVHNTHKTLIESAGYISRCCSSSEEIPVRNTYEYSNVFNDTAIHFFIKLKENSQIFEGEAKEPKYTEDPEFITREIDSPRP